MYALPRRWLMYTLVVDAFYLDGESNQLIFFSSSTSFVARRAAIYHGLLQKKKKCDNKK